MFRKVLVANRGEIALRVIRACHELGIKTVAVYSEADRESLHVRFADDDICIGPPQGRLSYLRIPSIIAAAEVTGADAIHPGYGFLAENAEFADICRASNIAFIGPTGDQIRAMGDKASARRLAKAAGVPTVPGSEGILKDADEALAVAQEIGFPVIIKATAGGGGKGMRIATDADQFAHLFSLAQNEALSAFGNGDVYVEKYLARPRHVEFQVLGDNHGTVIHLGERDCSVQRRHQKLIEESPSPALTQDLRARMGEAAVRLAAAIEYSGAGTIEFLLDTDGSFYFMEMNTRIQVEHPVTEMVTGHDLVKEQIRVAAGDALSFGEAPLVGHAIEVRINAEDPYRNFQPCPGLITAYHPPGGPGVRVDTHVYAGYTVPPYYDSLLAKLITHGRDRAEALARLGQALDTFILEGVTTTIPFLARVIRHPDFVAGRIDTKFLERETHLLRHEGPRPELREGMKLDVVFSPAELVPAEVIGRTVVVIDVLRATTTMCTALDHGAREIIVTGDAHEAMHFAQTLDPTTTILAGERNGVRIDGFRLGNSPREMTREVVQGKTLVMTTTNGTAALLATAGAREVVVAAAVNLTAAAARARLALERDKNLLVLCAGRARGFALDDAYIAGRLAVAVLGGPRHRKGLNDAALVAVDLMVRYGGRTERLLALSRAGRDVTALGFRADVEAAALIDAHPVVPFYHDRRVTLNPPPDARA